MWPCLPATRLDKQCQMFADKHVPTRTRLSLIKRPSSSLPLPTMPKRPVTVQSDPESDDEYGSPKRARTDDPSDAEEDRPGPSQRRTQTQGRSGGRARARAREVQDEDSDAEDDEVDIPVAVDDEEFEKAHEDDVRAQIESKKNTKKVSQSPFTT